MTRYLVIAGLVAALGTPEAVAGDECKWPQCGHPPGHKTDKRATYPITNETRQRLGDLYYPGVGNRLQIRDNDRRIIGYIEADGTITDPQRREAGEIGDLGLEE